MTIIYQSPTLLRCISSVSPSWLKLVNQPIYHGKTNITQAPEHVSRTSITKTKTLPESRKLHRVSSTGVEFHIKVRELCCYCADCKTAEQCLNSDYVDQWCVKVLRPTEQQQPEEHPLAQLQMEDRLLQQPEAVSSEDSTEDNSTQTVNSFAAIKFETKKSQVCYMYFAKVKAIDTDEICVEYLEKFGSKYQYSSDCRDPWHYPSDIHVVCILPEPEIVVSGSRVKCAVHTEDRKQRMLGKFKCL